MKYLSPEVENDILYTSERKIKILHFAKGMLDEAEFLILSMHKKIEFLRLLELGCYRHVLNTCKQEKIPIIWSRPEFNKLYHTCCFIAVRDLLENRDLLQKTISGEIDPISIGSMPAQEKRPDLYAAIKELEERQSQVIISEKASTLSGRCRNCKQSQVRTTRIYNRGLDEAVGQQMTCINCGFSWKG